MAENMVESMAEARKAQRSQYPVQGSGVTSSKPPLLSLSKGHVCGMVRGIPLRVHDAAVHNMLLYKVLLGTVSGQQRTGTSMCNVLRFTAQVVLT